MSVPFTRQRVQRKCLPHRLHKLSSENAAPSEGLRKFRSCETCLDIAFVVSASPVDPSLILNLGMCVQQGELEVFGT